MICSVRFSFISLAAFPRNNGEIQGIVSCWGLRRRVSNPYSPLILWLPGFQELRM